MWITIIIVIAIVLAGIISYIMINSRKAEMQKYYGAAYKMIKEICLANALKNQKPRENHEQKVMIYLKWKTGRNRDMYSTLSREFALGAILEKMKSASVKK